MNPEPPFRPRAASLKPEEVAWCLAMWREALPRACQHVYGSRLVSLALFGSAATGRIGERSDVDVLLIVEGAPKSRMARNEEFEQVERLCLPAVAACERIGWLCELSPLILGPPEAEHGVPVFLDMTREGEILLDREDFLRRRLERLQENLRRYGARRVSRGPEAWTWLLKPDWKPGERIDL